MTPPNPMHATLIVLLSVAAAITFGVLHDLVTAHICIEYFTIGHPRLFATDWPVPHALAWGVLATWWVGALLGVPLALAARAGRRPKRTARDLRVPLTKLLGVVGACAIVAGVIGFSLASSGQIVLLEPLASKVPADRHTRFITDLWMHLASYGSGAVGGLVLAVCTWRGRR
jgi:hypothetical protein